MATPRSDRFDLFPTRLKTRKRTPAENAKKEAMERSERHANAAWAMGMLEAIRLTCRCMRRFNTDHVLKFYTGKETTHDLRALGPLMRRAAKAGYCKKASCAAVNTTRRSRHAAPLNMWDSLIFEGH
jgi:hypothetical protein